MRKFDYRAIWRELLTPEIVSLLTRIHEYKGEMAFFMETKADAFMQLTEMGKMQSIEAFNKMEGLCASEERLRTLIKDKTRPRTEEEKEIAGYRDVLNTIYDNYEHIPLKPSILLQLHRDLYKYEGFENGGKYRISDNAGKNEGIERIFLENFKLIPAEKVSEALEKLCMAFEEATLEKIDSLILVPMFLLDFLCLHPFNEGNGKMGRLLMVLLFSRAGYFAGQYSSMERLIERTKNSYYDCLQASSTGWDDNVNEYAPFVKYVLGILAEAYQETLSGTRYLIRSEMSKPDRVRELIKNTPEYITKKEILEKCPDISQITVQRALAELMETGEIVKIGGGRYTKYMWKR